MPRGVCSGSLQTAIGDPRTIDGALECAATTAPSEFHVAGIGRVCREFLWIEELREKFDAVGQAWAWTGEVAIGVHGEDAAIADGWEVLPALWNLRGVEFSCVAFCVVAAEHY